MSSASGQYTHMSSASGQYALMRAQFPHAPGLAHNSLVRSDHEQETAEGLGAVPEDGDIQRFLQPSTTRCQ